MLGGNAEYMAKAELKKLGYDDEVIAEANSFSITEDEKIQEARRKYIELHEKFKEQIKGSADEVRDCGGLYVIGTERHETRRIDNQLRGRSGRQGDPGKSRFYLSLEDDLMRLFGGDRLKAWMSRLNVEEDSPLEANMLTKSIESAQKKIEGRNFAIRKNVLQYDDVLNRQREIIYNQRDMVLNGEDLREQIMTMMDESVEKVVSRYLSKDIPKENWNLEGLKVYYMDWVLTPEDLVSTEEQPLQMTADEIVEFIKNRCHETYMKHEEILGSSASRDLERAVLLTNVDEQWMDHIDAMEDLKRGINLRAYGQRDPVVEYRLEGFDMFDAMINSIRENTVKTLLSFKLNMQKFAPNILRFPQ